MSLRSLLPGVLSVVLASCLLGTEAEADSAGLLVQAIDGQLVTGTVSDDLTGINIPVRTFSSQFPSTFAWNDPGFHSLGNPPAGISALPVGASLDWDFLPMRNEGHVSNLLFWDGVGSTPEDVSFGPLPDPNYSLTLFGRNNEAAAADGSADFIPGRTIDIMSGGSGLRMHAHRFFFLDDNDGLIGTTPVDGIYLIAMQLRMDGFETSDPFFMVWGTLGIPLSALEQAAVPWVQQREQSLTTPPGDFNSDGLWDCSDADALVAAIAATSSDLMFDMNGDGVVSLADLTEATTGWLAVAGEQNEGLTGGRAYLIGDANLDGNVDGQDFIAWNGNKFTSVASWCGGDFNADGAVDGQDFIDWNSNKFSSSDQLVAVPEPYEWAGWILLIPAVRLGRGRAAVCRC